MRVLFLAPQPFFQERGTPIAVRLACEVISKRPGDKVDLLTYHEGLDVEIPNITLHRIKMPACIWGIGPGISIRKLLCDVSFFIKALMMVRAARGNQYQLVHAVEEAVFMAWVIKLLFGIPYLYDMDSSLALQLTEKWYVLRPLRPIFEALERLVIRSSMAVVPVCDALAVVANKHGSPFTTVLSDISLLSSGGGADGSSNRRPDLRQEIGVGGEFKTVLYIGNLESYQGIDLLVRAFAVVAASGTPAVLAVIGGRDDHIAAYRQLCVECGISERVRFLGPRPVSALNDYLLQADVLVSPRVLGNNTPMKVYSYLHSGIPLVATNLPTHTQVLTGEVSALAEPNPHEFGDAILNVLRDEDYGKRLGSAARQLIEDKYTFAHFERTLNGLYDRVQGIVEEKVARAAAGF